jgi:HPr kinase/phosphorylase
LLATLNGVLVPRIPIGSGTRALPLVVAALTTTEGVIYPHSSADCLKGIGNHITHTIATE